MQRIEFKENLDEVKDTLEISNKENVKNKNYIRVVDVNSGKVLVKRKENIITLRGRTFALEKLYEDVNNVTEYTIKNYDRTINLFSIGNGGCPEGDPFSPIIPTPLDTALANRIPFITIPDGTDPITIYPNIIMSNYPVDPDPVESDNLYYYKRFNIRDPEWNIDLNTNTTCKKLELLIDIEDCRDENINELGLYFSTNSFTEPEMYSRVTFPTWHMSGGTKILVEYYTFA